MNAEQAPKSITRKPTGHTGREGRRREERSPKVRAAQDRATEAPHGSAGVMASACLEEEIVGTREALAVVARDHQPKSGDGPAWAAEGGGEVRSSDEAG